MHDRGFVVVLALPVERDDCWIMVKNINRVGSFPGLFENGRVPRRSSAQRAV